MEIYCHFLVGDKGKEGVWNKLGTGLKNSFFFGAAIFEWPLRI